MNGSGRKPVLVVGGRKSEAQAANVREVFGAEVLWAETPAQRNSRFRHLPDLERAGLVIFFTRATGHWVEDALLPRINRLGIPVLRISQGSLAKSSLREAASRTLKGYDMPEQETPLSVGQLMTAFRGPERIMPTAGENRILHALADQLTRQEIIDSSGGKGRGVATKGSAVKKRIAEELGVTTSYVSAVCRRVLLGLDLIEGVESERLDKAQQESAAVYADEPEKAHEGEKMPLKDPDERALDELEQVVEMERREHLEKIASLSNQVCDLQGRLRVAEVDLKRATDKNHRLLEDIRKAEGLADAAIKEREALRSPITGLLPPVAALPPIPEGCLDLVLSLASDEEWQTISLDDRVAILLRAINVLKALQ